MASEILDQALAYSHDQPVDSVQFYEAEALLLSLWDRVSSLKLEVALATDYDKDGIGLENPQTPINEQLDNAEKDCLEARTSYLLSERVSDAVINVNPIHKALFAGADGPGPDQLLVALLHRRDVLEIAATNLTTRIQDIHQSTMEISSQRLSTTRLNQAYATRLSGVSTTEENLSKPQLDDSTQRELLEYKANADQLQQQACIMKSVISAVISGSGINWADQPSLVELVLDDADNDSDLS